jgi:lysine 6-dehydrogenase
MRKKIAVLGAGMVGRAIALDLADANEVFSFDIDGKALAQLQERNREIRTQQADLRDVSVLEDLIAPIDLVVSAVPGFMGMETIRTVISCGKDLVDISFLPEDVLPLDTLAREHGVTVITDCGVAPGLPNIIAGHYAARGRVKRFEYMVGGLPFIRTKPFEYKAPFSPCDVIEEYTRPARMVENGVIVTKPAMSDTELIDFPQVGTLEAFNSDGLRSLLYTLPDIPEMKEKTLRYPGHIEAIRLLRDAGFLSREALDVSGTKVVPFDVTSEVLFKAWKLGPEEREFTIMRIVLEMQEGEGSSRLTWDLFDTYDAVTGISSMARTTGYTCTAAVNMLLKGLFVEKGLFPPERIALEEKPFHFILGYLADRGIRLDHYSEYF